MCLAIPGKILTREEEKDGRLATGKVDFGGVVKDICLAYVPEAKVGDYVIVHVGFALNVLDEAEAQKTFEYLQRLGELADGA
jgi:hydrogenase expression/formation protein HypC